MEKAIDGAGAQSLTILKLSMITQQIRTLTKDFIFSKMLLKELSSYLSQFLSTIGARRMWTGGFRMSNRYRSAGNFVVEGSVGYGCLRQRNIFLF